MNEEKDPKWFVWERSTRGITSAALYRGMPAVDGSGKSVDFDRFAFKKKLEADEQQLTLDELRIKYPCPPGENSTHTPRQQANLTKSELDGEDPIEKFFPRA